MLSLNKIYLIQIKTLIYFNFLELKTDDTYATVYDSKETFQSSFKLNATLKKHNL